MKVLFANKQNFSYLNRPKNDNKSSLVSRQKYPVGFKARGNKIVSKMPEATFNSLVSLYSKGKSKKMADFYFEKNSLPHSLFNKLVSIDYDDFLDYKLIEQATVKCCDVDKKKFHPWVGFFLDVVSKEKNLESLKLASFLKDSPELYDDYLNLSEILANYANDGKDISFIYINQLLTSFYKNKLNSSILSKFKELMDYSLKSGAEDDVSRIAKYIGECFYYDFDKAQTTFLQEKYDYVKNNIMREDLPLILRLCCDKGNRKVEEKKVEMYESMTKKRLSTLSIEKVLTNDFCMEDGFLENLENLKKMTPDSDSALYLSDLIYGKGYSIDYFKGLLSKAMERKDVLARAGEQITTDDIKRLLFEDFFRTQGVLDFLGEKTFFYSFLEKKSKVVNYIQMFGNIKHYMYYERMVEMLNPQKSIRYKEAESNLKELKAKFSLADGKTREEKIKEINKNYYIMNSLLKNSIKDPQDKIKAAYLYKTFYDIDTEYAKEIIPFLNPKTIEDKINLQKKLNAYIVKLLSLKGFSGNKELDSLDFSSNKYLPVLFNSSGEFRREFVELLNSVNTDVEYNRAFDDLPQNITTRFLFKKNGIDYRKYVDFNPDSYVVSTICLDVEKEKQALVEKFRVAFNDESLYSIPYNEIVTIQRALERKGYIWQQLSLGTSCSYTFYKDDGKPFTIKDLHCVIDTVESVMSGPEFQNDDKIEHFEFHDMIRSLKTPLEDFERLKDSKTNNSKELLNLVVRKTDLNDIVHSIFLGNYSSCCAAVGKYNDHIAPSYILNKFVSSIEVVDGKDCVGNSMCYFADVNGELAFVIDNIELKPEYQYLDILREGFVKYAKQLCSEVGKSNIPIYVSSKRQKLDFDEFEPIIAEMKIVGDTGNDFIYLDFLSKLTKVNSEGTYNVKLYRVG